MTLGSLHRRHVLKLTARVGPVDHSALVTLTDDVADGMRENRRHTIEAVLVASMAEPETAGSVATG